MQIDNLINRLLKHPLGLTTPEINEIVNVLTIAKKHFANGNGKAVIRSMSAETAAKFDEFIRFQNWQKGANQ